LHRGAWGREEVDESSFTEEMKNLRRCTIFTGRKRYQKVA
jgi:hypothetical protein